MVLGLLLGLTVVGCSDKDRNSGSAAGNVNITYTFAKTVTLGKATQVNLTAYNAQSTPVFASQDTTYISEHQDVTPEGTVGAKRYQGNATVSAAAAKLVLTYYDVEGNEVGTPDIHYVSNLQEGADIDFTEEVPVVTWTPADADIRLSVGGDAVAVSAKDAEGNALTVLLVSNDTEHIDIKGNTVAGTMATDEAVAMTATAKDSEGKTVSDKIYSVIVANPPTPHTIWDPVGPSIDLYVNGEEVTVTAKDEDGTQLSVELTSEDEEHIDIKDKNVLTGIKETETVVTVNATASDSEGTVVGRMTYLVVVKKVVWSPADDEFDVYMNGDPRKISASDGRGTDFTVNLTSDGTEYIDIAESEITAKKVTDAPVQVNATAKDSQGNVAGTMSYLVTVKKVEWSPADAAIELYEDNSVTITASDSGTAITVNLDSKGTEYIDIAGSEITAKKVTDEPVEVTATAKDSQDKVVGTMSYLVTVKKVVWSPAEEQFDVYMDGDSRTIKASDGSGTNFTVTLDSESLDYIKITGSSIFAKQVTTDPVEVTATAKDSQGKVVDTMSYLVNVKPKPNVVWSPSGPTLSMKSGQSVTITATDGGTLNFPVTVTSGSGAITISGNTVIANPVTAETSAQVQATCSYEPYYRLLSRTDYLIVIKP